MLKNYLKTAWRQLKKRKIFSAINIASLVLGLTSAFLILLYIQYEMNYDQFHKKGERIVRLTQWFKPDATTTNHFARCVDAWQPWVKALRDDYPEIENIARLTRRYGTTLQLGANFFSEKYFFMTDPDIFNVFTIPLIAGNPQTALESPNAVIITESMAQKYLDGNPLGQVLNVIDNLGNKIPYKISGVMKDWPDNSHMHINFLASNKEQKLDQDWAYTYLLLSQADNFDALQQKLPDFILKQFGEQSTATSGLELQRLKDIHLHSHLDRELKVNGDIRTVYVLWAVAFLIIIIACINFINLTTAGSKAWKRSRY